MKYFKYAISEIFLVVIGILIALQINNWNQHRLDVATSDIIKKALHDELVKDTILLGEYIGILENLISENSKLIERYEQKSANFDTIKKLAQEYNPYLRTIRSFNSTTYTSIVSSGKIELLDPKLKTALMINHINQNISLQKTTADIHLTKTISYAEKYTFTKPSDNYYSRKAWEISDERDFVLRFTSLCRNKNFTLNNYLNYHKTTLQSSLDVLKILKENA